MSEDMYWGIISSAWDVIEEAYQKFKKDYPTLCINTNQKEKFNNLFKEKYQETADRFMVNGTILDSHKQAAILTICCLQANIITHNVKEGELSVIPQMIAINVGLSYMRECLNEQLKKRGIRKRVKKYYFPVAIACDTPYSEIVCRLLYYEQTEDDMNFNVLELADRYFLLEYINLLQQGIEPSRLK